MRNIKLVLWIIGLFLFGWTIKNGYHYFFSKQIPELIITGIQNNGCYGGDIACVVSGSHPYKVGKISVLLNEKPLIYNFSIGKQSFEHPFTINTRTLTNGKHILQVKIIDGTYHKKEAEQSYQFHIDNIALQAAFVAQGQDLRVFQGRTLHLQFQTNKRLKEARVTIFNKEFYGIQESKQSLIYEAFIPIDCEEVPNEYMFTINCIDNVNNIVTLENKMQVVPFPFKKGQLTVSSEKVEREKEIGASQQLLNDQLEELVKNSPREKLWYGPFYAPTTIHRITTEFGVIRITQERGLYAHKAVDIANAPKSLIWAPQSGIVVVKDRYAYSGNTVVIDHGCGIFTLLFHLDSFAPDLEVGQKINKGNPVGKLGMSGYASGYHLHWEMRINNVAVDPLQWTKQIMN